MTKVKKISEGGARGSNKVKALQPLTKTVKTLYNTPAEKFVPDWGDEGGFGPQSSRATERREMMPRKVPRGRGRAFVS